jgi:hypothetical protein
MIIQRMGRHCVHIHLTTPAYREGPAVLAAPRLMKKERRVAGRGTQARSRINGLAHIDIGHGYVK